jgi:hypothetical protein
MGMNGWVWSGLRLRQVRKKCSFAPLGIARHGAWAWVLAAGLAFPGLAQNAEPVSPIDPLA